MAIRKRHLLIGIAAVPVAAVIFAWLGIFNVAATGGHWQITNWFLHFAMRSSVRTYALGVEVPPRDTSLLQPAAGHFAQGCAFCHGAPGVPPSPAALSMLPTPPNLSGVIGEWTDAQLFRIVRHGVRYTGMPAWPAPERTDEVWAMVAFLRELPSLDARKYRELAEGSAKPATEQEASFDAALAGCARCHGSDGIGRDEGVPILAGQSSVYLQASLEAYAKRKRPSGMMEVAVEQAGGGTFEALAKHYAAQPRPSRTTRTIGPALVERGKEIAERGIPRDGVPACLGCHGGTRKNPAYPNLAGQKRPYLENQLRLFVGGKRGGTAYAHIMAKAVKNLSETDIRSVAAYLASME
jgi:cytochrome c553